MRRMAAPVRPKPPISIAHDAGSGTAASWPRISPPGKVALWRLKYALPPARLARKAVRADAVVPPLLVMKPVV